MGVLNPTADPRLIAAMGVIGRTGATDIDIRYSDDTEPVVWLVVAHYEGDGRKAYQTAAALDPLTAILELCENLIDGGYCVDCNRPTAFDPSLDNTGVFDIDKLCWITWRYNDADFKRACET